MTFRRETLLRPLLFVAAVASLASCNAVEDELSPLEQARVDLAAGRAGEADFVLRRMLASGANSDDIAAYLGEVALSRDDLDEARRWLDPGQFSQETQALGLRMQGRLAMAMGNLPEAGRAFDRALAIDRENPELWVDIGRLRYRGGEQLQALEAAERAVALGPENAAALQFRGQMARDAFGMQTGVSWFQRALEFQPGNVDLRVDLAATLGDAGRAREALDALREGEGHASADPRGLFIQAVIAARGGKLTLARDLLDRSELQREGVPAAVLLAAIIDIEDQNFDSAAQMLDRLHSQQPDNERVVDLLALALSRSGSENELVHRFGERAAGPNGSAYLRTLVGRALEALGDREAAARYLDLATLAARGLSVLPSATPSEALQLSRDAGATLSRDAIRDLIARGRPTLAAARARELAQRHPGAADVLALLGDAELADGNFEKASGAYARSAMVRRPWPLAPRLASSLGMPGQAMQFLKTYTLGHPSNGDAAVMLADAYAMQGDWRKAELLLDHAIGLGHGRVPRVLAARSIAAAQLGKNDDALAFALAANELQPMNPFVVAALIGSLPDSEKDAKAELSIKFRSLVDI